MSFLGKGQTCKLTEQRESQKMGRMAQGAEWKLEGQKGTQIAE
jgi:hypothetical protein